MVVIKQLTNGKESHGKVIFLDSSLNILFVV